MNRIYVLTESIGTGNLLITDTYGDTYFDVTDAPEKFYYVVSDDNDVEYGIGEISSGSLVRLKVISSSNSNALVSWTAGEKKIAIVLPAEAFNTFKIETYSNSSLSDSRSHSLAITQPAGYISLDPKATSQWITTIVDIGLLGVDGQRLILEAASGNFINIVQGGNLDLPNKQAIAVTGPVELIYASDSWHVMTYGHDTLVDSKIVEPDYYYLQPNVRDKSAVTWFGDGLRFGPTTYRIHYICGAIQHKYDSVSGAWVAEPLTAKYKVVYGPKSDLQVEDIFTSQLVDEGAETLMQNETPEAVEFYWKTLVHDDLPSKTGYKDLTQSETSPIGIILEGENQSGLVITRQDPIFALEIIAAATTTTTVTPTSTTTTVTPTSTTTITSTTTSTVPPSSSTSSTTSTTTVTPSSSTSSTTSTTTVTPSSSTTSTTPSP